MYEEDRERALRMYENIFDEVNNETAVLQLLVSPTRQAVNLARAYDARERKAQGYDEGEPAYQLVIEDLRRQAGALVPPEPRPDDGQISLFGDDDGADDVFDSLGLADLPQSDADAAAARPGAEQAQFPDEDREGESAPLTPPPAPIAEPAEETPAQDVDDFSDAVDAFLADFTVKDELAEQKEPEAEPAPISTIQDEDTGLRFAPVPDAEEKREEKPAAAEEVPAPEKLPPQPPRQEQRSPAATLPKLPDMTGTTKREASVPLLILYILLAVPVGLLCLAVILPFALISLCLAGLCGCVGLSGIVAAFGFAVFADILLVFGLSLALAAIGLLLLWVFVWLLIGAIPGVVRGLCALGRKLCYREVSA